jgi:hypothetical protein
MRTAHTADLDAATLAAARMLLDEAFAGDFGGDDWDHTLGGIHALAYEGGELVGPCLGGAAAAPDARASAPHRTASSARPEDGYIYVLEGALRLDRTAALTCDWRGGDIW